MDTESSSEDQTSTECSTDSSDDDEKLETAQICGARIQLPQGLCERKDIFNEFFSIHTWNLLSEVNKQHLKSFLPTFPDNDEHEKNVTLYKLFNNEVFRFTSPLDKFHENLKAGYYRPDIARMRLLIKKAERKEAKYRHKLHRERLKEEILQSRSKLLNLVKNLPPGVEPKMERLISSTPSYNNPIAFRTKRRYFQELSALREKVEESGFSSDENYPEGPPAPLSRKQKRHLNTIKNSVSVADRIVSTFSTKTNSLDLERLVLPNYNPFFVSEDSYKNLLLNHKRRRLEEADDPEYNISGITITDVINRTDLASFKKLINSSNTSINSLKHNLEHKSTMQKKKIKRETPPSIPPSPELLNKSNPFFGHSSNSELDSDSDSFFDSINHSMAIKNKAKSRNQQARPSVSKFIKKEIKLEPVEIAASNSNNIPNKSVPDDTLIMSKSLNCVPQYGKITPATLSDLDGIDMMNLPIDLDDSNIDILEFNNKPELMQDTHANFLSLVRDIICSTNEHRMSMKILEERLKSWQENPISPLNDWYSLTDNWVLLLPLAINFLSGNFSEQPEDFVPYIEYKEKIDMYQWIGAGRDSDSLLSPLCQYWLEHRNEMKLSLSAKIKEEDVELSDRSQTPPPPRCPTSWCIRKPSLEEIQLFQEQERRRYQSPHKAFTYRCNGYESVVGPVKGIYNNQNIGATKARGHSVLTADRPNYVTILTLVRDATARLPNGEGTRADICELLKLSQYLSLNVPDNVLQSVVSGALDRMHTQFDPCVKYESKRKVWIYLHRNRSEEDFERIHQQYQGMNKNQKKSVSKGKPFVKSKGKTEKSKNNTKPSSEVQAIITKSSSLIEKPKADSPALVQRNVTDHLSSNLDFRISSANSTTKQIPVTNKISVQPNTSLEQPIIQQRQRKDSTAQVTQSQLSNTVKPLAKQPQKQVPTFLLQEKQSSDSMTAIQSGNTSSSSKHPQANKNLVKIISSNQGKSLIIPNSNAQMLKQIEQRHPQIKQVTQQPPVTQQILQSIAHQKLLLQKQNMTINDQKNNDSKSHAKIPVSIQHQILQSVAPQLQNIKNVTLLRNPTSLQSTTNISNSSVQNTVNITFSQPNISQIKDATIVDSSTTQSPIIQEQVIQSGVQNKISQPRLTPAQQQQILQSLKQKALPLQQTVISSQYRAVSKSKIVNTPLQKQTQPITAPSLLGQTKVVTSGII